MLPNDLLSLDMAGFYIMPPDFTGNNQRAFVPRAALASVEVLGGGGESVEPAGSKEGSGEGPDWFI